MVEVGCMFVVFAFFFVGGHEWSVVDSFDWVRASTSTVRELGREVSISQLVPIL